MSSLISPVVPGSKSLSQRALISAALARGASELSGLSGCDDVVLLVEALEALGFSIQRRGPVARVQGQAGRIPFRRASLWAGDSGANLRFLLPVLASAEGRFRVSGSRRLFERPLAPLLDALRAWGARFELGRSQVQVVGCPFSGGEIRIRADRTSQFASGILLAAPRWEKGVELRLAGAPVSSSYLRMTEGMMRRFGARITRLSGGAGWRVAPGPYRPARLRVEPDASACAFWTAACAVTGRKANLPPAPSGSLQGDWHFRKIVGRMAAGDGKMRGIQVDLGDCPDLVPPLAAIAPFASSPTEIRGIAHLAGKESDRLEAIRREFAKLGIRVDLGRGRLRIHPKGSADRVRAGRVDSHGDHRIAMMLCVLGLRLGDLRIRGASCVSKSFPGFYEEARKFTL